MKKKQPSSARSLLRWLAAGVLCLFTAVVLLLFLLTLGPGEAWLKRTAEARLQDALGKEVKIGWLETNLLSRLQLREVQIYESKAGRTTPFLTLGYAKLEYSLTDLLLRRLRVRSLGIDSLNMTILRDTSGAFNLPLPSSSVKPDDSSKKPGLHVQVDQLSLTQSSLQYLDELLLVSGSLKNVNFAARRQNGQKYECQIRLDSAMVEYKGTALAVRDVEVSGFLSPSGIRLNSFSGRLPGLRFAGNAQISIDQDTSVAGELRVQGAPDSLVQLVSKRLTQQLRSISGDLDLTVHLAGSLSHPELEVKLVAERLDVGLPRIQKARVEAHWEPGRIDLGNLKVELLGGTISGHGEVLTDSLLTSKLSMSVRGVDLNKVWESLHGEPSPYQGKISGQLTASGPAKDPKALDMHGDFAIRQTRYRSKSLPDFSTKLSYEKELASFWLGQGNSEMAAKARLHGASIQGEFRVRIPELEPLAGLADIAELTGEVEMEGVVSGKLNSPAIRAEIEARDIRYQNFPLDSLNGTIIYHDRQARIDQLHFAGNLSLIDSLEPPFNMTGIQGGIMYRGQASGMADSLTGEVTVELVQPRFADIGLDEGFIKIVLEKQQVQLSSLLLRHDSLLIRGSGEFDIQSRKGVSEINLVEIPLTDYSLADNISRLVQELDDSRVPLPLAGKLNAEFDLSDMDRLSLHMQADQMDLERIRTLLPQPQDIGGLLGFNLDFSGNVDDPQAELDFHLRKPRFRSIEMDSLQGHLSFADQRFQFEPVELHDRDNYSQIRGMVELEKRADGTYFVSDGSLIEGQAKAEDLDLSLLSAFMPEGARISGRGSFDLSLHGTLANPRAAGTLSIVNGLVQPDSAKPGVNDINLNLSLQDSIIEIQDLKGIIQETPFNLQAQITASQWKHFDVRMNLAISDFGSIAGKGAVSSDSLEFDLGIKQMDLSLLLPFAADLNKLAGSLDVEIKLSGSPQNPELNGRLEIRDLLVQPVFLSIPLDGGIMKLRFDENRVMVDSLFARVNSGFFFAWGVLSHERGQLSDVNLQATMSDLKIDRSKEVTALIDSARFDYRRQNNYFLLDGDMTLGECRMLVNFRPQSILPFVQAVEKPSKDLPPFLQQTRLDVRVRESEKIWIDNNLARLRIHTELGIIGSPAQPNFTGRVSVEEGYILYLDRKFKVKNGVVDFVDPDRLNPIIDFAAEAVVKTYRATEVTPYTVTISIAGPLDEVVVELKSEPPLDKSNILSLLTLGATRDELVGKDAEGKEGSLSNALLERAQSFSSQKISGYTTGKLGDLLGLDQMSIEGNLFRFDKSWGPQLLASKRISRRMTMTYITTVGHFNERSIRLDYELSKHFSFEGETDQRGRSGMNLKYKLRSK